MNISPLIHICIISLHRFPKRRSLKAKWLEIIGEHPSTINHLDEDSLLCCEHFDSKDLQRFQADDTGRPPILIEISGKSKLIPTQKLPSVELDLPLPPELPSDIDMDYVESQLSSENISRCNSRSNSPKPFSSLMQRLKNQSKSRSNSPKPSTSASVLQRLKEHSRGLSNSPKPSTSTVQRPKDKGTNRSNSPKLSTSTMQRINYKKTSRSNSPKPSTSALQRANSKRHRNSPNTSTELNTSFDHTYSIGSCNIGTNATDELFWTSNEICMNTSTSAKGGNVTDPANNKVAELIEEWLEYDELEDESEVYVLDGDDDFAGFDDTEPTITMPSIQSVKSLAPSAMVTIPMASPLLDNPIEKATIKPTKFSTQQNGSFVHERQIETNELPMPRPMVANNQNDAAQMCKDEPIFQNEPLDPEQSSYVIKEEPEFDCSDVTSQELQQFNEPKMRQSSVANGKSVMKRAPKMQPKTYRSSMKPHISLVPPSSLMSSVPGPYPINLIAVNPNDHKKMVQRAPPTSSPLSTINQAHHQQLMPHQYSSPLPSTPFSPKPMQNVHSSSSSMTRQPNLPMTRKPPNKSMDRQLDTTPHIIRMIPKKKPSANDPPLSTATSVPVSTDTMLSYSVMSSQTASSIGLPTSSTQSTLSISSPAAAAAPPIMRSPHQPSLDEAQRPTLLDEPLPKRRKTNKNELKSEIKKLRLELSQSHLKTSDLITEVNRLKFHYDQTKSQLKELIRVNIILSGQINPDCQCYRAAEK